MTKQERLNSILNILKDKNIISTVELAKKLYLSPATLRRDLIELESNNLISRSHGKVGLVASINNEFGYSFRELSCIFEKNYICDLAKPFLKEGNVVFLDSSSTLNNLCFSMNNKHFTVITNCLQKAANLRQYKNIDLFVTGGHIKHHSSSILGQFPSDFLSQFYADIAFLSCSGLDTAGIYESDHLQSLVKRQMINQAKKVVLAADNTKFDTRLLFKTANFDKINVIITDKKPPPAYSSLGCEIIH